MSFNNTPSAAPVGASVLTVVPESTPLQQQQPTIIATDPATSTAVVTPSTTVPTTETGPVTGPTAAAGSTATTGPTAPTESTATTVVKHLVLQHEPGGDVPEEPEDIQKQKAEGDFSGEYGKRVYCKRHNHSMIPLKIIFMLGGRFPFTENLQSDGTFQYKFSWFYPLGIYFLFSTITMLFTLILGLWNVAHIVLNITVSSQEKTKEYENQRAHEDVLVHRYYIPLIVIYSSLIHGLISALLIMKKRHYIAHYLTFWSKAVYTMHMDVSKRARGFSIKILVLYILTVVTLVLLVNYKFGPTAVGLPMVFGDLTFRTFLFGEVDSGTKQLWLISDTETSREIKDDVRYAGAFLLIFTFTASKSAILFFIYHCKTLQSAFAYWNGRVYAAVLRGGEFSQTEEGRTTYKLLFKDHCILMDLMEGMDQVSAFTVESYFGCQVFSLFFELYFCIRAAKHGDNQFTAGYPEPNQSAYFIRPKDWFLGGFMLCLSLYLMFSAAKSAADVAEEAMAGLEVIRRKTMLGRKTDEELYFMLSMFSSYTAYKKMEISGGGYYYMNKDFVIGLISSVLSYFIILYQFQPVMDVSYPANADKLTRMQREQYGKFLTKIEGLVDEHYWTTKPTNDLYDTFRG